MGSGSIQDVTKCLVAAIAALKSSRSSSLSSLPAVQPRTRGPRLSWYNSLSFRYAKWSTKCRVCIYCLLHLTLNYQMRLCSTIVAYTLFSVIPYIVIDLFKGISALLGFLVCYKSQRIAGGSIFRIFYYFSLLQHSYIHNLLKWI